MTVFGYTMQEIANIIYEYESKVPASPVPELKKRVEELELRVQIARLEHELSTLGGAK